MRSRSRKVGSFGQPKGRQGRGGSLANPAPESLIPWAPRGRTRLGDAATGAIAAPSKQIALVGPPASLRENVRRANPPPGPD
jgi:hypothetical protein